ncbi:MAG TPA: hypothetical protein VFM18_00655 [Methanosarcina sp.]|nr:hypothetical protein [Methanosarcina sp.]
MSALTNKFLSRMFRKVDGLVWDLTTGQLGMKDNNGIYTLTTEGEGDAATFQTTVNPFDSLGLTIPAFATNTPLDQVQIGDIIVGESNILGWVTAVRGASLALLDKNGMSKNYTPPKVAIMGSSGALVVKNLFNLAGGQQGLAGIQTNLLPLLAMGGDANLDKVLPLILMQSISAPAGANAAAPAANGFASMLPLLLLSKGKNGGGLGDIDPLTLMALSGGAGAGGMNPMMLLALSGGLGDSQSSTGVPPLTRVSRP